MYYNEWPLDLVLGEVTVKKNYRCSFGKNIMDFPWKKTNTEEMEDLCFH